MHASPFTVDRNVTQHLELIRVHTWSAYWQHIKAFIRHQFRVLCDAGTGGHAHESEE